MSHNNVSLMNRISFALVMAICGFIRLLPLRLVWRLAAGASRLAYLIDGRRRRVALTNLDIAFGDSKSDAEKRDIARNAFKSLFLTIAESILIPRLAGGIKSFIHMPDTGIIARALEKKRGAIFLVSHFGNWELMAHRGVADGYRIASVARPLKNPLICREVERLRCYNGASVLGKRWIAREIISRLKQNWCVAILIDQYAGRRAPFVPFFGYRVSTSPAAALLAMATGAAVIPGFNVREEPGKHHIHICEPVEIVTTGDRDSDLRENCARFNHIIEEWVRRHPDQWLWMHRRWKRSDAPGADYHG